MRNIHRLLLSVALLSGLSLNAAARGGGWSHHASGHSSNSQALANSNGRFALDRDKGLDRAEDRRSAKDLNHEKTEGAHGRRHRGVVHPMFVPISRAATVD